LFIKFKTSLKNKKKREIASDFMMIGISKSVVLMMLLLLIVDATAAENGTRHSLILRGGSHAPDRQLKAPPGATTTKRPPTNRPTKRPTKRPTSSPTKSVSQ
jgi:hypothetical protein